jgi:PhzF family phenazine biosynthesis protein
MNVYHYDAFASKPNKGNPAGVVLNADDLNEQMMQSIAKKVGFNETAFILKSDVADIGIRYFTPGHEMDLCGHGTIASVIALYENENNITIKTIETKAGILEIDVSKKESGEIFVCMQQVNAQFIEYEGNVSELANVIGLSENDIDKSIPIVYGSTGIWTLLVPIKNLQSFKKMKPDNKSFQNILTQNNHASIHPFCLETYRHNSSMHGRHFSSSFSGTVEDITTGTASGVMGAYYMKYLSEKDELCLIVEQGQELEKDGQVCVAVKKVDSNIEVKIKGTAVFVKKIENI